MIAIAAFAGTAVLAVALSRQPPRGIVAVTSVACTMSGVDTRVGSSGDVNGTRYLMLEFTNVSGKSCVLDGYPRVTAYTGVRDIGSPAALDTSVRPREVTLRPGATARAELRYAESGAFLPGMCVPVTAPELRVFLPDQPIPKLLRWRAPACSRLGPQLLSVRPVEPWPQRRPGMDS